MYGKIINVNEPYPLDVMLGLFKGALAGFVGCFVGIFVETVGDGVGIFVAFIRWDIFRLFDSAFVGFIGDGVGIFVGLLIDTFIVEYIFYEGIFAGLLVGVRCVCTFVGALPTGSLVGAMNVLFVRWCERWKL